MAACAADVSIIANNHNASRAEAGRGASAFMQIDEHEAGSGRARSGTASRRRFALFCPLLQFLSYCKKHLPPLYIPFELVAINYSFVQYILLYNCLHCRGRATRDARTRVEWRGGGGVACMTGAGAGVAFTRAHCILFI